MQGVWYGQLDGKKIMVFCWNSITYEYDMEQSTTETDLAALIVAGVVKELGAITDQKTSIQWFTDKLYFRNGVDFKEYDGTTYTDAVGYYPIVAINVPPTGGGTAFEEVNLISGTKWIWAVGDNAATTFKVPEEDIDSIDEVIINGVAATSFSEDLPGGNATSVVPTPPAEAKVEIRWTKANQDNVDLILNHKYAIDFGVGNDTNVFLFGNPNEQHVIRFSGVNRPTYYPANAFIKVGTGEFPITDLKSQYQSLLVFKEDSTRIIKPESNPEFITNKGLNPYNYPYFDLNEGVGNLAPTMVQLIENNPVSLFGSSMWLWESATGVESEVNAKIISDRMKLSLQVLNLKTAVTYDYTKEKEYWVNVDNVVYIWNYGNNTMYKYTNIQAVQFFDVEGVLHYTSDRTINLVKQEFLAHNETLGDPIPCDGKLAFTDLDSLHLEKNMVNEFLAIEPAARTSVNVQFVTNKKNEEQSKVYLVEYILMDFGNVDFNNFSFKTNVNPQPSRIRGKIRKFTFIQPVFKNNTNNESLTIIKLEMPVTANRYSG